MLEHGMTKTNTILAYSGENYRFLLVVIFSFIIHSVVLYVFYVLTPFNLYTGELDSPSSLSINLLQPTDDTEQKIIKKQVNSAADIILNKNYNIIETPVNSETNKDVDSSSKSKDIKAQYLITQSIELIYSDKLDNIETNVPLFALRKEKFRENNIFAGDVESSDDENSLFKKEQTFKNGIIDSYRLPHGNLKVKIASIFGGIQCFEVREADLFNEFDPGAWMFTRC